MVSRLRRQGRNDDFKTRDGGGKRGVLGLRRSALGGASDSSAWREGERITKERGSRDSKGVRQHDLRFTRLDPRFYTTFLSLKRTYAE